MELLLSEGWEKPDNLNQGVRDHAHQEEWESLRERLESKGMKWEYQFAIVRDPYDKLQSRYWQRRREFPRGHLNMGLVEDYTKFSRSNPPNVPKWQPGPEDINPGTPFYGSEIDFFHILAWTLFVAIRDEGIDTDNNHWRPQHHFVDNETDIFRFEKIDNVLSALKDRGYVSKSASLPHLRHRNRESDNISDPPRPGLSLNLPWASSDVADIHKKVLEVYGKDFETFGYSTK